MLQKNELILLFTLFAFPMIGQVNVVYHATNDSFVVTQQEPLEKMVIQLDSGKIFFEKINDSTLALVGFYRLAADSILIYGKNNQLTTTIPLKNNSITGTANDVVANYNSNATIEQKKTPSGKKKWKEKNLQDKLQNRIDPLKEELSGLESSIKINKDTIHLTCSFINYSPTYKGVTSVDSLLLKIEEILTEIKENGSVMLTATLTTDMYEDKGVLSMLSEAVYENDYNIPSETKVNVNNQLQELTIKSGSMTILAQEYLKLYTIQKKLEHFFSSNAISLFINSNALVDDNTTTLDLKILDR